MVSEKKDDATTIGQRVHIVREKLGWTMNGLERKIASTLGTPTRSGQICRFENGEREPMYESLRGIALATGCNTAYLLLGVGPPFDEKPAPRSNLDAAIELLGDGIRKEAIWVARRMAAASPVDLGMAEWTLVLRDLASKL